MLCSDRRSGAASEASGGTVRWSAVAAGQRERREAAAGQTLPADERETGQAERGVRGRARDEQMSAHGPAEVARAGADAREETRRREAGQRNGSTPMSAGYVWQSGGLFSNEN